MEIGDVTNYSRIQIQRIEYAEDVKGARVETGDIVTRWASTVTVDHMDRCAVFTSAGELSWVSPETEVTVVGPPSWAGQPEELVAEYPGDPNLPGLVGDRKGWPSVIWHNRRLYAALVGWTNPTVAIEEILQALVVAPPEVRPILIGQLEIQYERALADPVKFPPDDFPWRREILPAAIVSKGDDAWLSDTYRACFDGSTVTLPRVPIEPHASDWRRRGFSVSVWGPQKKRLREYAIAVLGAVPARGQRADLPVVLIPRPDNEYNPEALSVAAPASFGGSVDDRQIGYIRDRDVWRLYRAGLHGLARHSRWEIACTALFGSEYGEFDLRLQTPYGVDFSPLVEDFRLQGHESPPLPTVVIQVKHTDKILRSATQFPPMTSLGDITPVTQREDGDSPRRIALLDGQGIEHGTWREGGLVVNDERHREHIASVLQAAGFPVSGSLAVDPFDLRGVWRYGGLEIQARRPDEGEGLLLRAADRSHEMVARYDSTTRILWVQDIRLEQVVRAYAERVGLKLHGLRQAPWPWELDDTVDLVQTRESTRAEARRNAAPGRPIGDAALSLVPEEVLTSAHVRPSDEQPSVEGAFDHVYEAHVAERSALFPGARMTGSLAACRLCGARCGEFTTAACSALLAYCQPCMIAAVKGVLDSPRASAASAISLIAGDEFDGQPMLESQLDVIHVDPSQPLEPRDIDRLLLLRFAVPRGVFPWTHLLAEAGLIDDGLRMARGTILPARDGHLCLSLREKVVDDFLYQHDIEHEREPLYPRDVDLNPRGRLRADWLLSDGTLVEMWGLPNDPAYAAKMTIKEQLANKHRIRLVGLLDEDLQSLVDVFAEWITEGTDWRWSPLLVASPRSARRPEPRPDPLAPGGGAFHAESRQERLHRCQQAVELRAAGRSRKQIAAELVVSIDTVGGLLRDGTFYADPEADPARLELAMDAHDASQAGMTKAEFRAKRGLSLAKSHESWRDGDVLFGARAGGVL